MDIIKFIQYINLNVLHSDETRDSCRAYINRSAQGIAERCMTAEIDIMMCVQAIDNLVQQSTAKIAA